MKISYILISALLLTVTFCGNRIEGTAVNNGKSIFCARAEITSVRIQNCDAEPCTIVKGENLPVEIDFLFTSPASASTINFSVFISYWGVESVYGSYLAQGSSCSELLPDTTCPATAGNKYTLKSNVYVDPESKDSLNGETTGQRRTMWSLSPTAGQNDYSTCSFSVQLDIVE